MRALLLFTVAALAGGAAGCERGAPGGMRPAALVIGRTGRGAGEFSYPRAAVWSPLGRLYVVDKTGRIQFFAPDGGHLGGWAMPQIDAGKPTGLGVGPDGRIYVADTHYGRVMVFEPDGRRAAEFGAFGTGPGQFKLPTDVAVGPDGRIYVGEYGGNDRISIFTRDYQYVRSFGGPDAGAARLNRPQSLHFAVDRTLWVADACNHRICRFDAEGALLGAFGGLGDAPGEFRFPYNAETLADGSLVVVEYGNNRVQHLTRNGEPLGMWGQAGREPGQLAYPWALAVAPEERIYIVDSGNNRVQVPDGWPR